MDSAGGLVSVSNSEERGTGATPSQDEDRRMYASLPLAREHMYDADLIWRSSQLKFISQRVRVLVPLQVS